MASIHITIEIEGNELNSEVWDFWFDDDAKQLVLNGYEKLERATRRHKHKVTAKWHRLMRSRCTIDKPTVPPAIAAQVRERFMSMITVEGET